LAPLLDRMSSLLCLQDKVKLKHLFERDPIERANYRRAAGL